MATKKTTAKKTTPKSMRKRSAKKTSPQLAVRHLRYNVVNSATPGTETSHFIDLAKDLSILNRRLMRQGRSYHVKRITVVSRDTIAGFPGTAPGQQDAGRFTVSTVPNNWVSQMAWKRGFDAYNSMNKSVQTKTNDIAGTWADFKVYLTDDMRSGTILRPVDNGGTQYLAGEWDYSAYVAPTAAAGVIDEYRTHMLGAHTGSPGAYTSIGLVQSYGDARATVLKFSPGVPNDASEDPLVNLFDFGDTTNQLVDNLETYNDNPPYDQFEYPGDGDNGSKPMVVGQATLADGSANISGFSAMCGLLELEVTSPIADDSFSVLVELSSGSYRGIKADVI
ncbi:MAG: hypothetical protein [Circular genetic element sp.]|nr:MAG: hypothetical protein [Circular genetic element sp.]